MKRMCICLLLLLAASGTMAQPSMEYEPDVVSQRGSLRLMPVYQRWMLDNFSFTQASAVLAWYQPVAQMASIALHGAYGSVSGDVPSLKGPTDIQFAGTYYLEAANLIFNVGVGIPVGKKKLAFSEFLTSVLLTSNVLHPAIPHFGTGLTLSPSLAWALPVSDGVVFGFGAMFLYRGEFSPLEDGNKYDPGDEVSFTGGLDLQLDESSSLSGDVVYSLYGVDKISGQELFTPGGKLLATVQYQRFFDDDRLLFLVTFRSRAKADFSNLIPQLRDRVEPNQAEIVGAYTAHFSKYFLIQFFAEGRLFQAGPALQGGSTLQATFAPLTGFNLFGIGLNPELKLSETLSLPIRLKYLYGSSRSDGKLRGLEAGLGIAVSY